MKRENEKLLQLCLEYFEKRPVYKTLFLRVKDKYASFGRLGGSIRLSNLTLEEKKDLEGFFQKDYTQKRVVTISVSEMEKALNGSRFSGLSWDEILTAYFGETLISKKEEAKIQQEEKDRFFLEFYPSEENSNGISPGAKWLKKTIEEKRAGYSFLLQHYREEPEKLKKLLHTVLYCIEELPSIKKDGKKAVENTELLPVFAARTTGNPHFFDEGSDGDKVLHYFLEDYFESDEKELTRVEKKSRNLYEAGILRDDLSNDILVYGIRAYDKRNHLHAGIEGFRTQKEPLKLTLWTLGGLGDVCCAQGSTVYVVENPAVFSVLIQKNPEITAICSYGQLRLAVLVLMDLMKKNCKFCYAGDFDPEGLSIAQKLKERYKEKLTFWNYQKKYYHQAISDTTISEERLSKLKKITQEELQEIKDEILIWKRAAYQEGMLESYKIRT